MSKTISSISPGFCLCTIFDGVEIKIGVSHIARELVFETGLSADEVLEKVNDALASKGVLQLDGVNGRRLVLSAEKLGYVEIGVEQQRQVGFGV